MEELKYAPPFIICPVAQGFPLSESIRVIGLGELGQLFEASN